MFSDVFKKKKNFTLIVFISLLFIKTRPSPGQQLRKVVNFVEFYSIPLNFFEFAVLEKRVTDGLTEGSTDKASERVAFRDSRHNSLKKTILTFMRAESKERDTATFSIVKER